MTTFKQRPNKRRFIGEIISANFDEDSRMMAVEVGLNCLEDFNHKAVDGLFLASTTVPL